eukprot:scaffold28344_cov18-Tisochrysis_lutea.AAC.1
MRVYAYLLAAIYQEVLIMKVKAFNGSRQASRHMNAPKVGPEYLRIIHLLKIQKCYMQSWRCITARPEYHAASMAAGLITSLSASAQLP